MIQLGMAKSLNIDDELWLMAIIKAKKQGKSLSKVIRDFLKKYIKGE